MRGTTDVTDGAMVAVIDIGTTKISSMIGEYDETGSLRVSGVYSLPSRGLRRGMVTNMEVTTKTLKDLIYGLEQEAGRTVTDVIVGITANGVEGINSTGVTAVGGRDRQITREDVSRVVEGARAIAVPMDREILHVLTQNFTIDGHVVDRDPVGMMGVRLEAGVHIITGSIAISQNLTRCIEKSGYKIREMVVGAIASLHSVLTREERDLGVLLIDIGGEATDFFLIQGQAPCLTGSLPIGGANVTGDIGYIFKTTNDMAEMLKLESAVCWAGLLQEDHPVIIPGVSGRPPRSVSRRDICEVVQPRMEELFQLIRKYLADRGLLYRFSGGVVLTGGGSELPGAAELAGSVFSQTVRIGRILGLQTLPDRYRSPAWATTAGLVQYGAETLKAAVQDPRKGTKTSKEPGERKILEGMKNWLREFF
jgi:cell division protein FtsA